MPSAVTYLKCPDPGHKLTDRSTVVPRTEDWVWSVGNLVIRKAYQFAVLKNVALKCSFKVNAAVTCGYHMLDCYTHSFVALSSKRRKWLTNVTL